MKQVFFFLGLFLAASLTAQSAFFPRPANFEPKQLEGRADTVAKTFTPSDTSYRVSNFVDGYATICKTDKPHLFGIVTSSGLLIRELNQVVEFYDGASFGIIEVRDRELEIPMNSIQPPAFPGSYFLCDKNGMIVYPKLLAHFGQAELFWEEDRSRNDSLILVQPLDERWSGKASVISYDELLARTFHTTMGVIDLHGKTIVELGHYKDIYTFHNGYAVVKSGSDQYGYIDRNGKEIVPCMYDWIGPFSEGFAVMMKNRKWGYVDLTGKEVIAPEYDQAEPFKGGCAVVAKGRIQSEYKFGLINTQGKKLMRFESSIQLDYQNGYYRLCRYDREKREKYYGWVNLQGKEVIPAIYTNGCNIENGVAVVYKNNAWGLVDTTGNERFFQYGTTIGIQNGMIGMSLNGKWGFIDVNGNVCVSFEYQNVGLFGGPLAPVKLNNKWGFVNRKGKLVIPCEYSSATQYETGYCMVTGPGPLFFDPNGKPVREQDVKRWKE